MHLAAAEFLASSPCLQPSALAETLAALVRLPSVNPSYGGTPGGERAVMEWAAAFLRRAGLSPVLSDALPGRPNLRVRLEGERPGPPLVFETHIDTVSVTGMKIDPFGGRIENGRLWGRGSTDAKGQATAILHALAAWAAADRRPPRPIEAALVIDEEFGFGGAKALLAGGLEAAAIVIAEPTDFHVVTSHKGSIRWWIEFEGKSAHSSRPDQGINAIASAAALIAEIDEFYSPWLEQRRVDLLSPPTINVAMIEGGIQSNLVPPACRINLERRTLPGEDYDSLAAEFEELFARVRRRRPTFRATQEPPTLVASPLQTDPRSPLAMQACALLHEHGMPAAPVGADYATDASVLAALGVPIIVFGPGSIAQAHTDDEFMDLDHLTLGARLYAELIARDIG